MNVTTLKDTLVARRLALNPWTGFYFLQSLLINSRRWAMNLACFIPWHLPVCYICCGAPFRASRKRWSAPIPCWRLCTIPLAGAYGAPNFNTLLALHATNVEESTEILTIFPWYNYLLAVFIFASGSLRFAVGSLSHHAGEKWIRWACCSASGSSFSSRCKPCLGRCIQGD